MAGSGLPKDMSTYMPELQDQGVKNLVGTPERGVSIQKFQAEMPADGILVFEDNNIENMADENYMVLIHNHTGSNQGIVPTADRETTQLTVTGPTTADLLDVVLIGTVKGQLA